MARLRRMHEQRRRAGRGQRRRDLARHVPRLAHARDDHPARAPPASAPTASAKLGPSVAASCPERRRLDADHPPPGGDQLRRGRVGRRRAHRGRRQLWAKMSISPQPARSSGARCGRKSKQARASSRPPLARQPRVQRRAQPVQVEHVRGGIVDLRRAQLGRAPVARLLLLGDVDVQQLARPDPSARAGRYRCAPAARRSWCSRPARPAPRSGCSSTAMSNRPKWNSFSRAGSASSRARFGASACPARSAPGARRRRRPRAAPGTAGRAPGCSPMVSVSTATTGPRSSPSGRSPSMQVVRHVALLRCVPRPRISGAGLARGVGARERTRTSTTVKSLAPEASASTNSATRAGVDRR